MSVPTITQLAYGILPDNPVVQFRVLDGEDDGVPRDKVLYARSDCRYFCPNADVLAATVKALKESDEKLRLRPEELMLWEWGVTWVQPDPTSTVGAGTVVLGVSWYDKEFYEDRSCAYLSVMHRRIYAQLGLSADQVQVRHFLADYRQAA